MQNLLSDVKIASEKIKNVEGKILLVSHLDADGICSAAIMVRCFEFLNKEHEVMIVKKITPEIINKIVENNANTVIFTDIGSGYLDEVEKIEKDLIILDHHIITHESVKKNLIHVNPEIYKIPGITGSGITYLVSKEILKDNSMVALGIVGTIGDSDESDFDIFEESADVLKLKSLKLYGRYTRPLHRAIQYSNSIPNINTESEAIQFLSENKIEFKCENDWRTLSDLDQEEIKKLSDAIIRSNINENVNMNKLFGDVWILKNFPKEINDAKEFVTLLNSCGRLERPEIGIGICLGKENAFAESQKLIKEYRRRIRKYLKWTENNPECLMNIKGTTFILAKDNIEENMIGTIASMLFNGNTKNKTIIGLAYSEDGIKISARSSFKINDILREAAEKVGGYSGGHDFAAGATIPREKEQEFINICKNLLEKSL